MIWYLILTMQCDWSNKICDQKVLATFETKQECLENAKEYKRSIIFCSTKDITKGEK